MSLLLSLIILFSPAFTSFNLGQGIELLRSNLLSTFLMGGVIFSSISSTNLIQKELRQKTIISILSRPVSVLQFYLGKLLGTFAILSLFSFVLLHVCWFSLVMGTPDTASTKLNYIPALLLFVLMMIIVFGAILINYTTNKNIISIIYLAWAAITPLIVLATYVLSPMWSLPIPSMDANWEFIKASGLIYLLILTISSFSVAIGTFTKPLVNLVSCIVFLMLGLMAPGLQTVVEHNPNLADQAILKAAVQWLPNFHSFWMAEMISLGQHIPFHLVATATIYGLCLMGSFTCMGTYTLMRRDFS